MTVKKPYRPKPKKNHLSDKSSIDLLSCVCERKMPFIFECVEKKSYSTFDSNMTAFLLQLVGVGLPGRLERGGRKGRRKDCRPLEGKEGRE